jgi:hypothetical protein
MELQMPFPPQLFAGTKIYLSQIGERGFFYPVDSPHTLEFDLDVTYEPSLFSGRPEFSSFMVLENKSPYKYGQLIWVKKENMNP